MAVFVTAASTPERAGGKTLLSRPKALSPRSIRRLVTIWADGGFRGDNFLRWLMYCCRLGRDYEQLPESSETFVYRAMMRIMVMRLA